MARIGKMLITEIAPDTYAVNECGMAAMYVLKGTERALVIDAGMGMIDLKGLIESMTSLPYDVVLTHGHTDHTGAAPQFKQVYLHKADWELIKNVDYGRAEAFAETVGRAGSYDVFDYKPSDIVRYGRTPELVELKEGMIFPLGDRNVEIFETPGHTKGSCVLLDERNKILFSGDACNENLLLMGTGLDVLSESLLKIKKLENKFERNYSGHLGFAGHIVTASQPEQVVNDALHICQGVKNGTMEMQEETDRQKQEKSRYVRYGTVKISFMQNQDNK